MLFLLFTCAVLLAAGCLAAFFVGTDDFEGRWRSIGVIEENRIVPFPGNVISHEVIILDGRAQYLINGDPMNVDYRRRKLEVDLTAELTMVYNISIEEGRLILTDPHGMRMAFEKIQDPDDIEELI